MDEVWKPVVGYEDKYEVSNLGRVRSLDRLVGGKSRGRRLMRGRVIKQQRGKNGYMYCALGATKKALVHRLVLEAFIGPSPDGTECCHNDNDRTNNAVDNLRWDTRYNNCQDTRAAGTHWQSRKTHCPKGHEYDMVIRAGDRTMRACRACRREYQREWERVRYSEAPRQRQRGTARQAAANHQG